MPTSGSSAVFATNAVFMALATAAVALRFYERHRLASYLHADDYLILVALVWDPPSATETLLNICH